jgi:hypothetical protein
MMKSTPARYSCHELYQHWIHKSGKHEIMSTGFNSMGYYNQGGGWSWCGPMKLRSMDNNRYYINGVPTCPGKKIHPYIIRNGFKGNFHNYNPAYFFKTLLTTPLFETFLKTGQFGLLNAFDDRLYRIKDYWPQIRICLRNKYIIKDASDWFDYLNMLKHFHRSITDPMLVCPADLKMAHDTIVAEKRAQDERNEAASKKKKEKEDKIFKKAKKKLMDLKFIGGKIMIVPLKSITDFKKEEKVLDHCVYSSEYHKKAHSFIMSARKDKEILETIEISLRDFKVKQCRGYRNEDSKYHKQILKILEKNINLVEIAFKKKDEPKRKLIKQTA